MGIQRIKLHSPFRHEILVDNFLFSNEVRLEDAEALLCEWQPHEDLLFYEGPKALYNSEAQVRRMFRDEPKWQFLFEQEHDKLFLYHSHPVPEYRVPMISAVEPMMLIDSGTRLDRTIAIISNAGNKWRTPEISIRNSFALHPNVDLYGSTENWKELMQQATSIRQLPSNFVREIAHPWNSLDKFKTMARYHSAICLENATEPFYFTEKFYAAAQVGCIPIYHAHPTVSETILKSARWVDPIDFDFDVEATLLFALSVERESYAKQNYLWLNTHDARRATLKSVFRKLGEILLSHDR